MNIRVWRQRDTWEGDEYWACTIRIGWRVYDGAGDTCAIAVHDAMERLLVLRQLYGH